MNRLRMLVIAVGLCAGATVQCQKANHFHWDWHHAQELDLKQNLANSRELPDAERGQLLQAIAQRMKKVMESGENPTALATKTRVKFIDLNGDGTPEVIAQPVGVGSGCGATGNCPFWVFEKTATGYNLILGINGVQVFTIEPTATNGFRDIVLGSHDSASERTLLVFRYSDGRYRRGECYNANRWTDEGGFHKLAEPKVTPCAK